MSTVKKKKRKFTKKEKRWAIAGLIFVVIVLAIFLSIAIPYYSELKRTGFNKRYKYDGVSLVGKWQEKDSFNDDLYKIYDFYSDGKVVTTLYVKGIEKVKDVTSTYRVEDKNTLVISYAVGGVVQSSRSEFSINDNGSILVLKDNKNKYTVLEEYKLNYNKDTQIFGEWVNTSDPSEIYTFNENYTGMLVDSQQSPNDILFSTNGDTLYYFINEYLQIEGYTLDAKFVIDGKYKIENDILTFTVGDKITTFTRK